MTDRVTRDNFTSMENIKTNIHRIIKMSLNTITMPEEKSSLSDSASFVTLVTTLPIGVLSKYFKASL
jgi:hypothetical protein